MRYILWVAGLLGACDVIQNGCLIGRQLEIVKKRLKLDLFDAGHVEYDIIKDFAAFCGHFCILHLKGVKNTYFSLKMA